MFLINCIYSKWEVKIMKILNLSIISSKNCLVIFFLYSAHTYRCVFLSNNYYKVLTIINTQFLLFMTLIFFFRFDIDIFIIFFHNEILNTKKAEKYFYVFASIIIINLVFFSRIVISCLSFIYNNNEVCSSIC